MTLESGHDRFDRERAPRPTAHPTPTGQPAHHNAAPYNAVRHGNHVEESPELLRWRADLLMDEMMMGGVDVSAADGNRTFSGVDAPVVERPPSPPQSTQNGNHSSNHSNGVHDNGGHDSRGYENGGYANGRDHHHEAAPQPWATQSGENGSRDARNGHTTDSQPRQEYTHPADLGRPTAHLTDHRASGYPSPASNYRSTQDEPRNSNTRNTRETGMRPDDTHHSERRADHYTVPPRTQPAPSSNSPSSNSYDSAAYNNGRVDGGRVENGHDENGRGAQYPARNGFHDDVQSTRDHSAPRPYPDPQPRQPRHYADHYADPGRPQPEQREDAAQPAMPPDAARYDRQQVDDGQSSSASYPSTLRTTYDTPHHTPHNAHHNAPGVVESAEQLPRSDRLHEVEQQYEQFRREQSTDAPPVAQPREAPPRPAARPPLPPVEPTRHHAVPPRVTPPPVDEHTQWATGPDKWEYQDFGANPQQAEEDSLFGEQAAPARRYAEESAVRHDPAQFVSAMSVMNNGKKRSTLLPRSTELDVDTLHREISDLHGEIAALLPIGNETSERARHLLDKAYSILQSDPSRSAEVEYYMQQVRTIVQRLYQSRQWSDLYRQRLQVYLLGWMGLSAMVLLARFFFQIDLEDMLMWTLSVDANSWLVAHWATFVGTAGAGAFGGALGALYTMRGHARGEYSFFDRKYGLRGLILPFMGLIVGMIGYVIFGLGFALIGINPALNLTAAVVPTTAALAFGFSQESIYGTRG